MGIASFSRHVGELFLSGYLTDPRDLRANISKYQQMLHPQKGAPEVLWALRVGRKATLPGVEGSFCGERALQLGHKS